MYIELAKIYNIECNLVYNSRYTSWVYSPERSYFPFEASPYIDIQVVSSQFQNAKQQIAARIHNTHFVFKDGTPARVCILAPETK